MKSQATARFPHERGIIWSYRLDGRGGGVQQDRPGESAPSAPAFDWFYLRSDEPESLEWLREKDLDPQVIDALTALETRPRMALMAGGVLINLRGVNNNPGAEPEDMISVRIWFNANTIVSARRRERRSQAVDDLRHRIEENQGPRSPGEFVVMLAEHLADEIGEVVDSIDEGLTRVETDLDEQRIPLLQNKLYYLRGQTAVIRRHLAPQREALSDLYQTRQLLSEEEAINLQHQADRIIHYIEDLELARERVLMLHGELQYRLAAQQNARMYMLSIVAAIFLPLTFLTGVFGMNVAGLPGLENPDAFLYLSIAMLVVVIALFAFMRWKRWL